MELEVEDSVVDFLGVQMESNDKERNTRWRN